MKPPSKKTIRRVRAPPVLAMIMVLHSDAVSLKSPAAICCTRNTSRNCLKNLAIKKGGRLCPQCSATELIIPYYYSEHIIC